jgi:hypothetical protein
VRVIGQAGGNNCHNDFARLVSGVGREVRVTTPWGLSADFDGLGAGRRLYEIKTGFGFVLNTAPSNELIRMAALSRFIDQSSRQQMVADECGYELEWVFNNRHVAELVDGLIEPRVSWRPFRCDIDQ